MVLEEKKERPLSIGCAARTFRKERKVRQPQLWWCPNKSKGVPAPAYDSVQFGLGNPCASDWCKMFGDYYAQGSPLELQQIANSDPNDETCGTGGANCAPGLESGDLRVWLPFAVTEKMNFLELYSVDADLAFDPYFCDLSMSSCGSGSYTSLNGLTGTQQYDYFLLVGLGDICGSNPQGSAATGNCQYSGAITLAQGYH